MCIKRTNSKGTTEGFIIKSKNIHGDKFDYSRVIYIKSKEKVKIICLYHGEFEQTPDNHINNKQGCPLCANNVKLSTKEFIKKCNQIHNFRYEYLVTIYINDKTKVLITCNLHGVFEQKAGNHFRGDGCPKCSGNYMDTNYFINKVKLIHGGKYDYSLTNYISQQKKIKIICPKHGMFKQNPNNHINGNGCPICKESKGERFISEFLINNNINFIPQYRFSDCRDILPLPFDFYLPDYNTCIEFNGRQHYIPIKIWGGDNTLKEIKKRDKIKMEYCTTNNIPLISIKYNQNILSKLNYLINPKT
jgi:desulfoferrodoxin (superoxide reductase-like protein)